MDLQGTAPLAQLSIAGGIGSGAGRRQPSGWGCFDVNTKWGWGWTRKQAPVAESSGLRNHIPHGSIIPCRNSDNLEIVGLQNYGV